MAQSPLGGPYTKKLLHVGQPPPKNVACGPRDEFSPTIQPRLSERLVGRRGREETDVYYYRTAQAITSEARGPFSSPLFDLFAEQNCEDDNNPALNSWKP
uniref:Uncharacterized protein n=1 Tax=Steinernema glaseri TaxID=37863 RepID=A0A1I7ZZC2_9BILA